MAAHLLGRGVRTDYHTFQHMPPEVIEGIAKIVAKDLNEMQRTNALRIIDSYMLQTGLAEAKEAEELTVRQTLKLSEWSISTARELKKGVLEEDKQRVHIDDNTGVLLQYNEEKQFIDHWRTRMIPVIRARENILFNSILTGVASAGFYKQFEFLCDGIIDFKSEDKGDEIEQYVRVSAMRGKKYDSKWQKLQLLDTGEVKLVE